MAVLPNRFGIDQKTVVKWKECDFTHDAAMGYRQRRTTISEIATLAFSRHDTETGEFHALSGHEKEDY